MLLKTSKTKLAAVLMAGVLGCSGLAVVTAFAQEVEDSVTGGGWIVETPSDGRANFGFVAGTNTDGSLFGHLNYVDREADLHVRSTGVVSYTVVDADTRTIVYDVVIDGVAATATVVVSDLGEPGWDDTFSITLSTGYVASGDLGGAGSGGGNIAIHDSE